jgi:cytochrome P450
VVGKQVEAQGLVSVVARLEAEALLTALARRVERLEPAGTPRRHLNNTMRGWESLPLRLRR